MSDLFIQRKFNTTPDKLFNDFADPNELKKWFMEQNYWDVEAHADVRVGGKYDVTMWTDIGNSFRHVELWTNCLNHLDDYIENPNPYPIYQDPEYHE